MNLNKMEGDEQFLRQLLANLRHDIAYAEKVGDLWGARSLREQYADVSTRLGNLMENYIRFKYWRPQGRIAAVLATQRSRSANSG